MRTPWVSRWGDALYNHLTAVLFVDKNFQNAEELLTLIRSEDKVSFSPWLHDCADVTSDYLNARKSGQAVLSPLRDEPRLPPSYVVLRKGLSSLATPKTKARKEEKGAGLLLLDKLAAQYEKLARAKTVMPYTTWLKIADRLEEITQRTDFADTLRAVRAIVALVREIFHKGKGENALRDVNDLAEHPLFRAIPGGQTHPSVAALWDFFCQAGRRKYGEEWGSTARVLQFSFMESKPETNQLKILYDRLMKKDKDLSVHELLRDVMNSAHWTEQELYILSTLYIIDFEVHEADAPTFEQFLKSLETLGQIGRKWRPQAPWPAGVRRYFENLVFQIPPRLLLPIVQMDLPYETMSILTLVRLALMNDSASTEKVKKSIASLLPLRLTERENGLLAGFFLEECPSRRNLRVVRSLLTQAGYAALLAKWVNVAVEEGEADSLDGVPSSRQAWGKISQELMEELATLPPDSPEGCLCRLRVGVKPLCLSNDAEKVEAFFQVLPANSILGMGLLPSLLTWPEVDPAFIVRLFEKIFVYQKDQSDGGDYLCSLAELIERMKNKVNQKAVAAKMCELLTKWRVKNKNASFREAVELLETLAELRQPASKLKGKKTASREAEISSFKKMWNSFFKAMKKRGQFPFDDE
ncbi:MAG: hypothetical protein LBC93_00055 [Synergistaceae bacterium]|nr:hypothetical protein [Synergistaceae bacterium]